MTYRELHAEAVGALRTLEAERDEAVALVRELWPLVAEYAEASGCDHGVGLCACGLRRSADAARALLARLDGGAK